jgi:phosphoribosylglycinamide formyltransferase-1
VDHTEFPEREAFDAAMVARIRESGADLVVGGLHAHADPRVPDAFAGAHRVHPPGCAAELSGCHGQRDAGTTA